MKMPSAVNMVRLLCRGLSTHVSPRPFRSSLVARSAVVHCAISLLLIGGASQADAEEQPLHVQIDQAIEQVHRGAAASLADDGEFVRRIYLDLVGRIPSTEEARLFLASTSPAKRGELIDELLKRDECNQHLAIAFDLMWMERRNDQHVPTQVWRDYLTKSFAANKPYDALVAEILAASGKESAERAPAKFYLDRDVEAHALTRDVSRMFLGRDIQCAQCHDHPLVSDYSQAEYYGLFAFLTRSYRFEDTRPVEGKSEQTEKVSYVAEKADGEAEFSSVFEPDAEKQTAIPGLPFGAALEAEPLYAADEAYLDQDASGDGKNGDKNKKASDDKNSPPKTPRFSRRQHLATIATGHQSRQFQRNAANRLWRLMLKRGLVEPPDLIHSGNPPIHPVLLETLADALVAMDYDVKAFLKEVALSKTYQRSFVPPDDMQADTDQAVAECDALTLQHAWQLDVVERLRADLSKADDRLRDGRNELVAARERLRQALAEQTKAHEQRDAAQEQLATLEQSLPALAARRASLEHAAAEAQTAATTAADGKQQDEQLAAAAKLLASRAETARQEHDKQLAEQQKAIDAQNAAQETLVAAGQLCQQARETLVGLVADAKEASGAFQALQGHYAAEQSRLVQLKHRLTLISDLQDFTTLQQKYAEVEQAAARLDDAIAPQQTRLSEADATLVELARSIDRAEQEEIAAAAAVAESTGQLDSLEQIHSALGTAAAEIESALDQLPGDATIESVQTQLQTRLQQIEQQRSAQQTLDAQRVAARQQCAQAVADLRQQRVRAERERDEHATELRKLAEQRAAAQSELDAAILARQRSEAKLRNQLVERFVVADVKAMSPEQLAASVVEALELRQRFRSEAEREWEQQQKKQQEDAAKSQQAEQKDDGQADAANGDAANRDAASVDAAPVDAERREREIEALYAKRVEQVQKAFVALYASSPGSPQDTFSATVDQALFIANDGRIQSWIRPSSGNLSDRLLKLESDQQLAEELYLSIFSRMPASDEVQTVTQYLAAMPDDRKAAIQDLIWGLLSAAEFRFHH